jgi:outer membrane lipoprotein SlyB
MPTKSKKTLSKSKKTKSNTKKVRIIPHATIISLHPTQIHSMNEEQLFGSVNGKVIADNWIRKTVDNDKMKIQGRINKKNLNIFRNTSDPIA